MSKAISREHLKERLDQNEQFVLVNVLDPESFDRARIPGSINVPVAEISERATELWPSMETDIVVYCSSYACDASPRAAKLLDAMGYANVAEYKGGLTEWQDAGYTIESSAAAA